MKKEVAYLFFIIILAGVVFASPISNDIHINIQVTDTNGNPVPGVYNFVFNITNSSDCSNVLYSNSAIIATDPRGVVSYYLPNVTLPFDQQYWICYYRNGNLIESGELTKYPYAFVAQNVTLSGIEPDTNFNISNFNISTTGYGFFNYLGSLLYPIINIFASGNVSATYFIGNGSLLTGIPGGSNPSFTNVNISNLLTLNSQIFPTGANNGSLFYNSTLNAPMFYNGTTWIGLPGTGFGSSIVSSGSNVNGSWIQYADGTMIEMTPLSAQIQTSSSTSGVFGSTAGSIDYGIYSWTYPIPFVSTPAVTPISIYDTNIPGDGIVSEQVQTTTSSSATEEAFSTLNHLYNVSSMAIGRWTNLNLGTGSGGGNGIVNTITNTNGTCTEYSNGIMECWASNFSLGSIAITSANGNIFYGATAGSWTFPANFTSLSSATGHVTLCPSSICWIANGGGFPGSTTSMANYVLASSVSTTGQIYADLYATGKWTNSTNINTPDVSTWGINPLGQISQVNTSRSVNVTAIGGNFLQVQEQEPSGTSQASPAANIWWNRSLNVTLTNQITGASMNINNMSLTLPAGTYFVQATSPTSQEQNLIIQSEARIFDTTHNVSLVNGSTEYGQVATGSYVLIQNPVNGVFTLTSTSNISLQQIMTNSPTGSGGWYQAASISGQNEVISNLMIWKMS